MKIVKYHENPKSPSPTTSLLAVYSALTKKLINTKYSPFFPLQDSKRIFSNSLRYSRYHDFRDTPISTNFSGILFGVADCRICDFTPTLSLFSLFSMYQVTPVSIYKSLIHRKQGKSKEVDRKGAKSTYVRFFEGGGCEEYGVRGENGTNGRKRVYEKRGRRFPLLPVRLVLPSSPQSSPKKRKQHFFSSGLYDRQS